MLKKFKHIRADGFGFYAVSAFLQYKNTSKHMYREKKSYSLSSLNNFRDNGYYADYIRNSEILNES